MIINTTERKYLKRETLKESRLDSHITYLDGREF